jgi:hypothetical protein
MLCFLCGKEISWLRSMVDRQYCSAEHRKEARLANSQVMREEEDDQEALWSVSRNKAKRGARSNSASNQASIVAFATLGALIVAMLMLPGNGSGPGGGGPSLSLQSGSKPGMMSRASNAIGDLVRKSSPVTLKHDFRTGLEEWTTVALNGAPKVDDPHDWKTPSAPTQVLPGTIRIWEPSKSLQNYQMEFQGEIEKKSLSWAFRASDEKNFYAAKLVITRPGPQPNAGLVHYVMLNGQERDRVQLPLPLTIERGENYRVMVSVQDDRFITYLNGQVISSWTDKHLSRGGVGFFSDNDDQQKVAWVNVSERDSFVGKMLSHFGLFVVPGSPLPGTPLR